MKQLQNYITMAKKKNATSKKKITTEVKNEPSVELSGKEEVRKVEIAAVSTLEKVSKVGFYAELREDDQTMLEPLVRLCCESKDGESEPTILTPWCTVTTLANMLQACMYLNPLIIQVIKDRQANAPRPEDQIDENNG